MNCEWVQQNITLYLYDELGDDGRHELEQHVARCKDCAAEVAAQNAPGPATFKARLFDSLYSLDRPTVDRLQRVDRLSIHIERQTCIWQA